MDVKVQRDGAEALLQITEESRKKAQILKCAEPKVLRAQEFKGSSVTRPGRRQKPQKAELSSSSLDTEAGIVPWERQQTRAGYGKGSKRRPFPEVLTRVWEFTDQAVQLRYPTSGLLSFSQCTLSVESTAKLNVPAYLKGSYGLAAGCFGRWRLSASCARQPGLHGSMR